MAREGLSNEKPRDGGRPGTLAAAALTFNTLA